MCVLAFAFNPQASASDGDVLRVISNRDEFLTRPTQAAHWWHEGAPLVATTADTGAKATSGANQTKGAKATSGANQSVPVRSWVLGGRDLRAGGSWLAMSRAGRLAILTNYRDPHQESSTERSRGDLVQYWVGSHNASLHAEELVQNLAQSASNYAGFNLLLFDCAPGKDAKAWVISNRTPNTLGEIAPGVHGLSNAILNTAWPKTQALKESLEASRKLDLQRFEDRSLQALSQTNTPADEALPRTGIPIERERYLSPVFIKPPSIDEADAYGTRCSTILSLNKLGGEFMERSYYPQTSERRFTFRFVTTTSVN